MQSVAGWRRRVEGTVCEHVIDALRAAGQADPAVILTSPPKTCSGFRACTQVPGTRSAGSRSWRRACSRRCTGHPTLATAPQGCAHWPTIPIAASEQLWPKSGARRAVSCLRARIPSRHEAKKGHAGQFVLAGSIGTHQPANSYMVSLRLGDGLGMQIFVPFGFWEFV
jgi:hypothetical protein